MVFFIGSAHKQLGYAIMCMFHVARGFVGFALSRIFPVSHELFEKLDYHGNKQLIFAQVKPDISNKIKDILISYYDDYEKPALVYSSLTVLCLVIDIISSLVYLVKVGGNDDNKEA